MFGEGLVNPDKDEVMVRGRLCYDKVGERGREGTVIKGRIAKASSCTSIDSNPTPTVNMTSNEHGCTVQN